MFHYSQFSSVDQSYLTLCYAMNCRTPGLPGHHRPSEFTQTLSIESMMPSYHLILCRPLFLLTSIFPNIRVYSNESAFRIRLPNYWSFSFNISPSNEHPGLIALRMDGWISLQSKGLSRGSSNTTLQSINSSALFIVQLSHPHMTTGKTIALASCIFVDKVMSLPFNMLSRLVERRRWHPTPVLLPGKSHGRRSLVSCSPCGHEESDMTERLHFHFSLSCIGEGNGNPLHSSCLENPMHWGAWWAAVYGVAQSRHD